MKSDQQVDNLEKALLERATRLAQDYLRRAEQQRDEIEREATERLRIREEREVLAARAEADRLYQQRVQASELRLQAKLDETRWEMIKSVKQALGEELERHVADEKEYKPVLRDLIANAVQAIEADEIIIELNERDRDRLRNEWRELLDQPKRDKTVHLSDKAYPCIGGVRARDVQDRIRVDNTFEGRMDRLAEEIDQAILERLFSKAVTTGELLHG